MRYSKRHLHFLSLLFVLILQTNTYTLAQSLNFSDSNVIPEKSKAQQNEFWNNTYSFPARPRNQVEVGAAFGMLTVIGDIPSLMPTFGFGLHVRKSLGYILSLRLQYINGIAKGQRWDNPIVNSKNPAWLDNSTPRISGNLPAGTGYNPQIRDNQGVLMPASPTINGGKVQTVFTNYKTHIQDLSLQGLLTLNNIRFHKQKTNFTLYGGAGIGLTAYHTTVNALGADGKNYTTLFNDLAIQTAGGNLSKSERKNILKRLKNGMDNSYETEAQSEKNSRSSLGKNTLMTSGSIVLGISFKLSNRINIALEDRQTIVRTDLLDGQQWQTQPLGDVAATRDFDTYNFLSLGLNCNVGAKAVEPLWWLNPLDYAYSEINNPKHMKLPKPIFDDTDGDGVTDQLDMEPETLAGAPVDTHGVAKDTDGDGVPDYKDKQLITPSECQPVDADGVGKCPAPDCCVAITKELAEKTATASECPTDYPSMQLSKVALTKVSKALLDIIANKLKEHPSCNITLTAYPKANKRLQAIVNKKIELVKIYLVETGGISADRINVSLVIEGGDQDTIDVK